MIGVRKLDDCFGRGFNVRDLLSIYLLTVNRPIGNLLPQVNKPPDYDVIWNM